MKLMIHLFLFAVIFGTSVLAQNVNPKASPLPVDIANWVGDDSDKILGNDAITKRLKKLMGEKDYVSFLESFETISPIEKEGQFLFTSGCMIRACTRLESAIAIDLKNESIHAAIYNEIEATKFFDEKGSKTPATIIKWVNRLENLKKLNLDENTDQPQAQLIAEFSHRNNEELLLELDNYVNMLQDSPTASGSIFIAGNEKSRAQAEMEIKAHVKNRGLDLNRLIFVNEDGNSTALIKLWFIPESAETPTAENAERQKGMAKTQISALLKELKDVVSKNAPDKIEAKQVSELWDKRKDLVGKTKSEVIELLFVDVKSVIKDSGIQYQIYSIFSFYKMIPDEPVVKPNKDLTKMSKAELVDRLIEATFQFHPFVGGDEEIATYPKFDFTTAAEAYDKQMRIESFDDALKVNNQLSPDQKTFVRANYEQLLKITDEITQDIVRKNFPRERWIREGLEKSFAGGFSAKQLIHLIEYFEKPAGMEALKYIRLSNLEELINAEGGEVKYTDIQVSSYKEFNSTAIGKQFIEAYIDEAATYEQAKEDEVRENDPNADGFDIYEPENLNKIINKFVEDNYKK